MSVCDSLVNVRNDGLRGDDIVVDIGDDGLGVRDFTMNVGDDHVCCACKLGLGADVQRLSYRNSQTHVEDVEDPVEVQPPPDNQLFVILRVNMPR